MIPILVFGISLGALAAFIAFVWWERTRELSVYKNARTLLDRKVVYIARYLKNEMIHLEDKLSPHTIVRVAIHRIANTTALVAQSIERYAHEISHRMSRSRNGQTRETSSTFLREVSTHKRNLDTTRIRRETSLTDDQE